MSDIDVADALDSSHVDVASLLCVAPPGLEGIDDGWTAFSIVEIWRATDPSQDDQPCVVFISEDGQEHCGLFGEARVGLERTRLVARVTRRRVAAGPGDF
jgi:hypothetical protein